MSLDDNSRKSQPDGASAIDMNGAPAVKLCLLVR